MTPNDRLSKKLGRYEIHGEIGRGGMAKVYKGYDPTIDRYVAIKVLPSDYLHDHTFLTRFYDEAKTLALVSHPAVVTIYDFGEENNTPYIIMKLIEGGDLQQKIATSALSLSNTVALVKTIASGLQAIHDKGILHRDIKPGNILLDQQGNPYISDFGIAKVMTESVTSFSGSDEAFGTADYMSPERASGTTKPDVRSDIYSLGCVIYHMLTGEKPYKGPDQIAVRDKHIHEPIPDIRALKPTLPIAVQGVVKKAMAKSPNDRYATVVDLANALEAASLTDLTEIRPIPPNPPQPSPKNKWLLAVVGSIVCLCVLFGGVVGLRFFLTPPLNPPQPTLETSTPSPTPIPPTSTNTPIPPTSTSSPTPIPPTSTPDLVATNSVIKLHEDRIKQRINDAMIADSKTKRYLDVSYIISYTKGVEIRNTYQERIDSLSKGKVFAIAFLESNIQFHSITLTESNTKAQAVVTERWELYIYGDDNRCKYYVPPRDLRQTYHLERVDDVWYITVIKLDDNNKPEEHKPCA